MSQVVVGQPRPAGPAPVAERVTRPEIVVAASRVEEIAGAAGRAPVCRARSAIWSTTRSLSARAMPRRRVTATSWAR